MEKITFENVPNALSCIIDQLERIESTLDKLTYPDSIKDQLLTISEAAEILNLAESTIYGKVSNREIPVIKKGKKLYFQKVALLNWVMEGKRSTPTDIQEKARNFFKKRVSK